MTLRSFASVALLLAPILILGGVVATPLTAAAGDGLAPEGDLPRAKTSTAGIDEHIGAQLPLDLLFRDESEQPINLRDCIGGKPTILIPMYYRCPMLCNLILQELVKTLRNMPQDFTVGDKFNVVAVSFDPKEHSDLASGKRGVVLEEYGRVGAEKSWRFLTGSKEAVNELMGTIGYRFEFDKSFKEYNHPSGIIIVTPEGKISRYFYGVDYDGEYNIPGGKTTLRLSLLEAAEGKGGSLIDKITLFCYRFDHMKGYSLRVLRAVQIGGVLTLLVIALSLSIAFWRERRGGRVLPSAASPAGLDSLEHKKTVTKSDGAPSGETA
jgi:protein SCO1/2